MCRRGCDAERQEHQDKWLLRCLGSALARRSEQPLEAGIYDAVNEAIQQYPGQVIFEDKTVGNAMAHLYGYGHGVLLGSGTSDQQGRAVADAYTKELEQRGTVFARSWLDNLLVAKRPTLMEGWLHALMQTLDTTEPPANLSATEREVRFSVYDGRCDNGAACLRRAAGNDEALCSLAFRVNCQVRGAQAGLKYANIVRRHYGELDSTIDVYDGINRRYGNEVASRSTSSRFLSALEANSGKSAHELARLWIEKWYLARMMVDLHSTVLKTSFVALQLALGINKEEENGIDWCYSEQISRGIRLVLTSPRGLEIVAAMPQAAKDVVKPKIPFIDSEPRQLGSQLADLLVGMIWGLDFVPTAKDW